MPKEEAIQHLSFFITTIIVKPNIQNKSSIANTHLFGPQTIPSSTGKSLDSLNVISCTSSRSSKCIYSRGYLYACRTVRRSSKSISTTKNSRKASSEPSSTSEEEKSDKKKVIFGPRMPTVLRVTIGKLTYRVVSFQLSVVSSFFASEGRTYFIS